jgi:hypothetical protein
MEQRAGGGARCATFETENNFEFRGRAGGFGQKASWRWPRPHSRPALYTAATGKIRFGKKELKSRKKKRKFSLS